MNDWIAKTHELKSQGRAFALATVVNVGGSTPREVGAKMIVLPDGRFHGTVGGGQFEKMTQEAALQALKEGTSKMHTFSLGPKTAQCCGGVVEVFIEVVGQGPALHLFGAGHVGLEVIEVLRHTPYQVIVHDDRPEWRAQAIQRGARIDETPCLQAAAALGTGECAAVLTHSHDLDLELVAILAPKKLQYLGLIGSQSKWTRFQQRLKEKDLNQEQIARIECPMGLPIGGKSPKEVAISLAARLLQVHHEHA